MSKENVLEFVKLATENPKIFDEAKKYQGEGTLFSALSKVAKEKGFVCSAEEIEEAMDTMSKLGSGEIGEDELKNVAGGGWWSDQWKKIKNWYNKNEDRFKAAWKAARDAWNNFKKP